LAAAIYVACSCVANDRGEAVLTSPPQTAISVVVYLLKFACTEVSLAMFTVQVGAVPEHAPLQLPNVLPAGGVAVSVTIVFWTNLAEQLLPQLSARSTPVGVAVTVPGLLRPTESVYRGRNVALTEVSALSVTVHVRALPAQAPPHCDNTLPELGLAVRVTVAPGL
jgi:hypothetical protein